MEFEFIRQVGLFMDTKFKDLLDYLDDQLEGLASRRVMARLKEQESWRQALERIRRVIAQPGIQKSAADCDAWPDENQLASYLEGTLSQEEIQQVEELLEQDDRLLGHLATCHRVLTGLTPLGISKESYRKFYALGGELAEKNWVAPTPGENPDSDSLLFQKPWEGVWQGRRVYAGLGAGVVLLVLGMLWKGNSSTPREKENIPVAVASNQSAIEKDVPNVPVKETPKVEAVKTVEPVKKVETPIVPKVIDKKESKKVEAVRIDPVPAADHKSLVELATLRPRKDETPYLFFKEQGVAWKQLSLGAPLISNIRHLCLPFLQSTLELSPTLWLGLEGWVHGSGKLLKPCQVEVTLHPPRGADLDLDFAGGRLILEASKKPAKIILRKRDGRLDSGAPVEMVLELQAGTLVVLESMGLSSPAFRLALARGKCSVSQRDQKVELLSRAGLEWDALGKRSRLGEKETELFLGEEKEWNIPALDMPGAPNATIQEMFLALKPGMDMGPVLSEWVRSPRSNNARRWVGCQALAGLDRPELLLEILLAPEPVPHVARFSALAGLRCWYGWDAQRKSRLMGSPENPGLLEREDWPIATRTHWLDMITLNESPPLDEDYEFLFEQLSREDKLLREMAHETLARWSTSAEIPAFLKGADLKSRQIEVEQWKGLLEQGFLPGR